MKEVVSNTLLYYIILYIILYYIILYYYIILLYYIILYMSSYAYLSLELYFPFMLSDMLSKSKYFDGIVPLIFDYMND